jgi:hypothetical protein
MDKQILTQAFLILLFILAILVIVYLMTRPVVVKKEIHSDTVMVKQTIYETLKTVVYKHLPARLDTVILHDTVKLVIASKDTVLKPYGDSLSIKYYFPPFNYFDLMFVPAPRPVEIRTQYVTTTVTLTVSPTFWDKLFWSGIGAGVDELYHAVKR